MTTPASPYPVDVLDATGSPAVYVLHENPDWLPPLHAAFQTEGVPLVEWPLTGGGFDLGAEPPAGVFWSRLSASSHTRGHAAAKEQARATLRWLESHGRRVVGGSGVVEFEVSKVAQYTALRRAGFEVPYTIAVFGADPIQLSERARELPLPFITKHNQGGKGLGVRRFDDYASFDDYVAGPEFEVPVDGITLLQEYVVTAEPFITRAEFIGGEFFYAVRVDTSAGSFELCPAEACAVPGEDGTPPPPLFRLRDEITAEHPLIRRLAAFLREHGIEIAGVEFFETADGRLVPYDINTNTNYNPDVEQGGRSGARAVARFLGEELAAALPQRELAAHR